MKFRFHKSSFLPVNKMFLYGNKRVSETQSRYVLGNMVLLKTVTVPFIPSIGENEGNEVKVRFHLNRYTWIKELPYHPSDDDLDLDGNLYYDID